MELEVFCNIRVAGVKVPQPEDKCIDHQGKEIMMGEIEVFGLMEVHEDEARAPEDIKDFDTDDPGQNVGEFAFG
jgi:hypothetical protein